MDGTDAMDERLSRMGTRMTRGEAQAGGEGAGREMNRDG
jgi:hypothetical protein